MVCQLPNREGGPWHAFCYNQNMKRQKKKKAEARPVFDSIRKPTAPPSQKFGGAAPEEKVRPSRRKAKHKKDPDIDD